MVHLFLRDRLFILNVLRQLEHIYLSGTFVLIYIFFSVQFVKDLIEHHLVTRVKGVFELRCQL